MCPFYVQTCNSSCSSLSLIRTHMATHITTLYMFKLNLYTHGSWSCSSLVLAPARSYSRWAWSLTVSTQISLVHYSVVIYSASLQKWMAGSYTVLMSCLSSTHVSKRLASRIPLRWGLALNLSCYKSHERRSSKSDYKSFWRRIYCWK